MKTINKKGKRETTAYNKTILIKIWTMPYVINHN